MSSRGNIVQGPQTIVVTAPVLVQPAPYVVRPSPYVIQPAPYAVAPANPAARGAVEGMGRPDRLGTGKKWADRRSGAVRHPPSGHGRR